MALYLPQGVPGSPGGQGPQGTVGDAGPPGAIGLRGDEGSNGPQVSSKIFVWMAQGSQSVLQSEGENYLKMVRVEKQAKLLLA